MTGISWFMVLFYDIYSSYRGKNKIVINALLCVGIFLLGALSAFIAYNRVASAGEQVGIWDIIRTGVLARIIEELGFNFYSISFVSLFVPSSYNYQYGLSYANSFLSLIPSTFDFWGIKQHIINPTQWLHCFTCWAFFLSNIFGRYFISNNWERYVRLICLFILITFPRRSLVESLIVIEYAIFFMGLYLIITGRFFRHYVENNR